MPCKTNFRETSCNLMYEISEVGRIQLYMIPNNNVTTFVYTRANMTILPSLHRVVERNSTKGIKERTTNSPNYLASNLLAIYSLFIFQ